MRDEKLYLEDLVEAAESIKQMIEDVSLERFETDTTLQRAVLLNFTIIGEAARRLSDETRKQYPEIAWSSIIGFRNIIVHAYFSLNLETVWKAATRRVAPLIEQIRAILRHDFSEDRSDRSGD